MKKLSLLLALLLLFSAPTISDQKEPALDPLFSALLEADTSPIEAQEITAQIWQIWLRAEDQKSQQLMDQGVQKMSEFALEDAVEIFSELIEIAPDFAEAWNKRATVYYLLGEFGLSSADVEETLRLEPRHFGALSGQGLIHLRNQREQAAAEWFRRALAVNPFMDNIRDGLEHLEQELKGKII